MKKSSLFILAFFAINTTFSQSWTPEIDMGYVYSSPTRGMRQTIRNAHGGQFNFGLTAPNQRLTYGLELNYGIYGSESTTQLYTFSDGTMADMDIRVTNAFTNLSGTTRLNLTTHGALRPYVMVKAGYAWYDTKLNIYDPNDWDSCEPVEANLLQKDGAFVYSIGGGLQVDLGRIFQRLPENNFFMNLQSSLVQGGRVEYMNADAPDHSAHRSGTRTSDVEAPFINTQTQVIHRHHVGYLYSSFISQLDFRLGVTLKPRIGLRR